MRLAVLSFLFCLFFLLPARGQFPVFSHDSIVIVENTLKKITKNVNFTILPGPVDGPSEKIGFAVLPMLVYNLDKTDTLSPPSSSAILFYFDFYGSWIVALKQSFYWNQNKWRAFISTGAGVMKLKFYGIGCDTAIVSNSSSNYVWTQQAGFDVSVNCFRKIYKGLYGGLEYRYNITNLEGSDSESKAVLDSSGIVVGKIYESVLIPAFIWDDRDNIFWSSRGYYASLSLQLANTVISSSRDYGVVAGWVSGYHTLRRNSRNLILAWHFYAQTGWGDMPYLRYSTYGQGDEVTGYTHGKYVNNSEVAIQAELRYELWKFISCSGYLGTGKVFAYLDTFGKSKWLHYGGLRLYFNIIPSRNIRLRIDGALGRQDWGVYVGIGQAF